MSVVHATFSIERFYPAAPDRVFQAFAAGEQKRRWFIGDREVVKYELRFEVGGAEVTSTRFAEGTPFAGEVMTNHTYYVDIVEQERIVFAYSMAFGDRRFSASLATVELVAEGKGTRLRFTEQGAYFERSDGAKMREEGWGKLLDQLGVGLQ